MEDRWTGKNIDLDLLSQFIVQFFKEKKFITFLQRKSKEYVIVAVPKRSHKIVEKIFVYVRGKPEDFSVKFVSGARSRSFVRLGTFLTFLGGGFLVLKGLESQEKLEKLEKEFWRYIDIVIWQLARCRS